MRPGSNDGKASSVLRSFVSAVSGSDDASALSHSGAAPTPERSTRTGGGASGQTEERRVAVRCERFRSLSMTMMAHQNLGVDLEKPVGVRNDFSLPKFRSPPENQISGLDFRGAGGSFSSPYTRP